MERDINWEIEKTKMPDKEWLVKLIMSLDPVHIIFTKNYSYKRNREEQ